MSRGISGWRQAAEYVTNQRYIEQQLPLIRGTWYYVDPYAGDNDRSGKGGLSGAVADLQTAYGLCTSDRGDGICVFSGGVAAGSTSSALTEVLDWAKYSITVFGVAAGGIKGRARVVAGTSADLAYLIDVQGQNNRFYNLHICNEGDAAAALGCLKVSGNRNMFSNCHLVGAGHVTPAAVALAAGSSLGAHDLNLAASENEFIDCIFGDNSIVHAEANANIVLSTQQSKNSFRGCRTMKSSTTAGTGAIGFYAANVCNGWITFQDCIFTCWYANEKATANTSMVIGSAQNNTGLLMAHCAMVGWSEWDSAASSSVYLVGGTDILTSGIGVAAG